ncbi:metallophosphoesterase [Lutibacter sp.]|uniref:metallophosphoesterase family protein n=1 Tax=Lutibacter sp. TaxID=1925666 RepID=UPI0027325C83|nr:metallophosphoesterase [Lutibacter sp.]MDP3312574.1 metallophosphoesterase [Lutibacter sp.]
MKILIYSDVHGNLPAFEKMITLEKNVDGYICLGDLVNYGPWSNECVDLAMSLPNSRVIKGNHEEAFIEGFYRGTNSLVQKFFNITFSNFQRKESIESFLAETILDKFICKHTIRDNYIYPDTQILLDNNYIIGHSHHQFEYKNNNFVLYNAGSVGQNRKYINESNYLIYDTDLKIIEMKSVWYNIDLVINEMKYLSYPIECINYYRNKLIKD